MRFQSWLGLLHTFEQILPETKDVDPCNPDEANLNDFVDDTPMMSGPSDAVLDSSCTAFLNGEPLPDTCPNITGLDPLFNYMNILDDTLCWEQKGEFTCQQIERMYRHWRLFRDAVSSCQDPVQEAEIELLFSIDERYTEDGVVILLSTQDGEELFNSYSDHSVYYNEYPDMSIMQVDLCVVRNEEYLLEVRDSLAGNGFTDGVLRIYLDGVLNDTVQGNFTTPFNLTIQFPRRTYAPSRSPSLSPSTTPTITPPSAMPSSTPTTMPNSESPVAAPTSAPSKEERRVVFPTETVAARSWGSTLNPGILLWFGITLFYVGLI